MFWGFTTVFAALTVPLVGNFMFLNRHNGMVVVLPHP